MKKNIDFVEARTLLLNNAEVIKTECVCLEKSYGRILSEDIVAVENVPCFERSPYDGYAFQADDTLNASNDNPITLRILEEVAAGDVPTRKVISGTATKILTGAPIPKGADAVVMFEKTKFTNTNVTLFSPSKKGDNIVKIGESVLIGQTLLHKGTVLDAGACGILSSQGICTVPVFNIPKIGVISTGSELVEASEIPPVGKIRNTNKHSLEAAISAIGCEPVYLGTVGDDIEAISLLMEKGIKDCDALILTGGVSVGDYDFTPAAMENIGADILVRGVQLKPGMACAYATKNHKLILGLSGNPASSLINFHTVVMPALRKIAGAKAPVPQAITVTLAENFNKKSFVTRILRGKLDLSSGNVQMTIPAEQGNIMLSSMVECDVFAIIPGGSDKLEKGTTLKGFLI